MSEGTATFDILCRAVDPAEALTRMSHRKLAVLITYLACYSAGIPGLLRAMAGTEAADRWHAEKTQDKKTQDTRQEHADCAGAMGEGYLP
jgi:hypothetical protein